MGDQDGGQLGHVGFQLQATEENGAEEEDEVIEENNRLEQEVVDVQITTGLKEYLQKNEDGIVVLKQYNIFTAKNLPLPHNIKSLLVRTVIGREKTHLLKNISENEALDKFVIKKERFELLANEICSIFKFEHPSVYFKASRRQGKRILLASGKLWHHYNYVKSTLKGRGVLNRKQRETSNVLNVEKLEPIHDDDDIVWLTNHLEPWEAVTIKWEKSHAVRRAQLLGTDLSIYDYIQKYSCLQLQTAKELFSIDFKILNPDKSFITLDQWMKIKQYLISCLDSANVQTGEDSVLVGLLKTEVLNTEKEDFIILYLLCHIIKPKRLGKRKLAQNAAPPRKLSVQERRETFILRVETANEVKPKLLDLKEQHRQNHETFQPVIVAVGPAVRIEKYYVVVDDQLYSVNAPLAAIELALQIFFSLNCNYPQNSQAIWVFLQRVLYKIELPFDSLSLEVTEHLQFIRRILG